MMKWCANIIFLGSNSLSHKGIWVALQEQEQHYSFLSVCVVLSCGQMIWLAVFGIFNVRTDVDAYDCIQGGCTDTRESALEADSESESNIPCRTWDSNPGQYCAWLFSRTLYLLSYSCPVLNFEDVSK